MKEKKNRQKFEHNPPRPSHGNEATTAYYYCDNHGTHYRVAHHCQLIMNLLMMLPVGLQCQLPSACAT